MRIGLDFGAIDSLSVRHGLFRYCVNLINGLRELATPGYEHVVFGSQSQPPDEIAEVFASSRWRWRQIRRHVHRGAFWRLQLQYAIELRRQRLDLFHALGGEIPLWPGCPALATIHDLMSERFAEYAAVQNSNAYRLRRWTARHRARHLIAISAATAADLRSLWRVAAERISVVHHGIEPKFFRPHVASANEPPIILSPFNLEPRKNLDALLEAVAQVCKRQRVQLHLFGRAGWNAARHQAFVRRVDELGLAHAIRLLESLDDEQLIQAYRTCDLFVFPSLYEGFGLPLLEAMAAGACVIAYCGSAMGEVVGAGGILTVGVDGRAFASAIAGALLDAETRDQLGVAAASVAAGYSVIKMARKTQTCYAEVTGQPLTRSAIDRQSK